MQEKDAERIYKHILLNTPKITIKNIKNFHTGLLNEVIREFPDIVSRESILVVALITSMSWLGPEKDGKPPKRIWNDLLLNKIKSHNIKKESQINKVLEFVIAYGCGKWRRPEKGIGTKWEHIWPGARKALSSIVDVSIKKEINLWLKNTVIQFPLMSSIDVMYYVHYIVEKLLFPEYVLFLKE